MRGDDIDQLLAVIDQEPSCELKAEKLHEPQVRMYSMMNILYQKYKKANELELMQARIFKIPIQKKNEVFTPPIPASASSLFHYHNLIEKDILFLIEIKDHLKQPAKSQLYSEILNGIGQHKNIGQALKCYRTLLSRQFLRQDYVRYSVIQEKMVNKLRNLQSIKHKEAQLIIKHILGLPKIGQPIIILISQLFQKIQDIRDFMPLFTIFQANFAVQPSIEDYRALFRICLPQTLPKIKELLENQSEIRIELFQIAKETAQALLQTMGPVQTSKTTFILQFIVELVKLGIPIWQEIITWESTASESPKIQLKAMLEEILIIMLGDFRFFQSIVGIAEKLVDIDQHSGIGHRIVHQLLKSETPEYLSHRVIRKFLAVKILKYNKSQLFSDKLFKSCEFTTVILELFNYENEVIHFYRHILAHPDHLVSLQTYLTELSENNPEQFKEFFCKAIRSEVDKVEHIVGKAPIFIKMLVDRCSISVAINLLKDLGKYPPVKQILAILSQFIIKFKNNEQIGILRQSISRYLNIILIRTDQSEIPVIFQYTLPGFLKEYFQKQTNDIFNKVSDETKDQLRRNYDIYSKKSLLLV